MSHRLTLIICVTWFWATSIAHAQPNLVIIVADDLGWGDVSYHGSEINTPAIDKLAHDGMRLQRFYAHPLCSPTRGALLTGRSPLRTGILIPFEPWFEEGPPLEEKFLPEFLQEAGYQTFAVGKWHLAPNHVDYHPQNRGFDHFYGHLGGFINYNLHTIWRGVDWQRNGDTVKEDGYSTRLIASEAVRLIETRDAGAPMFLYLAFNAPHSPLQAPDDAVAEYLDIANDKRRVYAAMVSEMDRGIARVVTSLESEGILDETLVVFFSDNGGGLSRGADNGELRGGKGTAWEGGIRVPALLHWPGKIPAASTNDSLFLVDDVLPTLMTALALTPEYEHPLDGIDQWSALMTGQTTDNPTRVLAQHNRRHYTVALFEDEWKLVQQPDRDAETVNHYLFRILNDPNEETNLASKYPDVVSRILKSLDRLPHGPIVGLGDDPLPTRTGLGGPASVPPDNRPANRAPYAESARTNRDDDKTNQR